MSFVMILIGWISIIIWVKSVESLKASRFAVVFLVIYVYFVGLMLV